MRSRETGFLQLLAGPSLKWISILAIAAGLLTTAYLTGRKHVRVQWEAERQAYRIAAAQVAAASEERERGLKQIAQRTEENLNEELKVRDARHATELSGLRNAINARRSRVSNDTTASAKCETASSTVVTLDELQRASEALVGIVTQADRERAALMACVAAWPANTQGDKDER